MDELLSKAYYLKPVKIIRDSVHGYVNLTRFDLELIDTVPFQRLSDIRQLTCQHVYPGARHTRFEHSLGVMELMRSSIKYLNRNRYLAESPKKPSTDEASDTAESSANKASNTTKSSANKASDTEESSTNKASDTKKPLIDESMEFNASVAALLHDVGHCPFSHMGETQFEKYEDKNKDPVRQELIKAVEDCAELKDNSSLIKTLRTKEKIGAVHEQLSCIVILRKYKDVLTNLTHKAENGEEACCIEVDFELIVRSILGLEYEVETPATLEKYRVHNVIVRLLNSNIFDMDKLDYIIRDSYLTGIGTPSIDTQRLFRNMYLDSEDTCNLVFTSKAVPALQNMIDARDGLYLYVYNHHAVVYSDFLNTYISRRLSHNYMAFTKIARYTEATAEDLRAKGLVPTSYLFSVEAVVEKNRSDSTWLSLLNSIYIKSNELLNAGQPKGQARIAFGEDTEDQKTKMLDALNSELKPCWTHPNEPDGKSEIAPRLYNTMCLTYQYLTRHYLKPWWKTVFEFSNFMGQHFRDDRVRTQACKFICDGGKYGLKADEMRSQIAKHVVYITKHLQEGHLDKEYGLIERLYDGDFFVIQRSTNFFSLNTIETLEIALKDNEILGTPVGVSRKMNEYYLKTLTNIIPQKKYESIYDKEGFYVFSKQPRFKDPKEDDEAAKKDQSEGDEAAKKNQKEDDEAAKFEWRKKLEKHYKLLEEIFVFVVKSLVKLGEQQFVETFQQNPSKDKEDESAERIYKAFLETKK